MAHNLYWDATYEIVMGLREQHPDADLEALGVGQLYQWILALPGFADDPALVNDSILNEILREWYEETNQL